MLKKILALFLAVSFIILPLCSLASASETKLGDVNNDGEIDQFDYILVKRHYFETRKLTDDEFKRADVNEDGVVDQFDYILIMRHYFGSYVIGTPAPDISIPDEEEDLSFPVEITPDPLPEDKPVQIQNIVSGGKSYTLSIPADSVYPDTYDCELTDGVYNVSASYTAPCFLGFNNNVEITIDLEDEGKQLKNFYVSYLSTDDAGINIPASIKLYGSNDNSSWSAIGDLSIPAFKQQAICTATLSLSSTVNYRYVRFAVARSSAWVFIDEILVESTAPKYASSASTNIFDAYYSSGASDSTVQANIDSFATGVKYDSSKGLSNIAARCSYSANCTLFDTRAPWSAKLLTDGAELRSAFEQSNWVGFASSSPFRITLNLGESREDVVGFKIHAFKRENSRISLPAYIDISISPNGTKFTTIGRCYATYEEQENFAYSLMLPELVKARFVRFDVVGCSDNFWVEEIEVFANAYKPSEDKDLYGDFDFPIAETPEYWEQGSDYNTQQNLILGLSQQITSNVYLDKETFSQYNPPETTTLLTDGKLSNSTDCYNGEWFQVYRGENRKIFYDLGKISSVSSVKLRFLEIRSMAIYLPTYITLVLSEDGVNWYDAGTTYPAPSTAYILDFTINTDKAYRARYAMITFDVDCHVFISEIMLMGKKNVSGAASLNGLPKHNVETDTVDQDGYAKPDENLLGGAKDICLIYHNAATTNESFFRPYVGYVDDNDKVVDTMFDGYLFLPSTGSLPSGGRPYGTSIASDWDFLFNELFKNGYNFDALNKTAETTKKELALKELKLKVFVAIPHMDDDLYDFGDIDHDGDNDPLTTLEGRVYVAKAYAERVIKEFNSRGYENLELHGFYWFHEEISGTDADTAKAVNAMFDEIGYQLFWIPYFSATGYSRWEEFGFDVACYQPNYAFSIDVDKNRVRVAADSAKRYGMCIEIEMDAAALSDHRFFQKYMDYLSCGIEYGYMNGAIHMYYLGSDDLGRCARSSVPKNRLMYTATYKFIKGTLKSTINATAERTLVAKSDTPTAASLAIDSDGAYMYTLLQSPEHGTITLSENGKFVYYPNKGFKGTDAFTYQFSDYIAESKECTVTITVE